MKKLILCLLVILTLFSLASCAFEFGDKSRQPENEQNPSSPENPPQSPTTDYPWDAYETISIAEAIEICMSLDPGTGFTNYYFNDLDYIGETVTVEFSLCDWNARGLKGYVFAVIANGEKTVNSYNFHNN